MAIEKTMKKIQVVLQYWVILEWYDADQRLHRRVYNFGQWRGQNHRAEIFSTFLRGLFAAKPSVMVILRGCPRTTCTCVWCKQLNDFPLGCDTKDAQQKYMNDKWLRDIFIKPFRR